MIELPKDPSGNNAFIRWLKRLRDCLRERTPIAGQGVKIDYTSRGAIIHAQARRAGGGGSDPVWL